MKKTNLVPDLVVCQRTVRRGRVVTLYPSGRLSKLCLHAADGRLKPWVFCDDPLAGLPNAGEADKLLVLAAELNLSVETQVPPPGFPFMNGPYFKGKRHKGWRPEEQMILRPDRLSEETLRRAAPSVR